MFRIAQGWICALLLAATGISPAVAQDLSAAAELLRSGRADAALEMLAPHEAARAGSPDYDYLLGLAALESGQPAAATVALERVLAVQPDHLGARLDMARAHFVLGQDALAREEFDTLRGMNPPPAAARTIASYLRALDRRADPNRGYAWMEAGVGYDSNVNNATSANALRIPALGVVVNIATSSTARRDHFFETRAATGIRHTVSPRFALLAGAQGRLRLNDDLKDLNQSDVGGFVGFETRQGRDTIGANVRYDRSRLDHDPYRDILALELNWRRPLSERTQLVSFGQHSALRYLQPRDKANNSNLLLFGTGVVHSLDAEARTQLSVGAYGGVDDAVNQRGDGDRNIVGGRVGAQHALRDDVDVYASAGLQMSSYDETNVLFRRERVDHLYDVGAGLNWRFLPGWSLRPQLTYSRNKSNIVTSDYKRTALSVAVRRSFQ